MYKIGDYIIYANDGVCEVEDIGVLNIPGIDKQKFIIHLSQYMKMGKFSHQ
ncbi:carD-like/TRCF domain protein [[Clostridium] sordellii ATCC 9714]|nr:carD-like/TRCF domain protein [[Clostridium] sordellii ATCC 9714] [Paeniclostridium sordellii ATCC 9714]